MPASTRPVRGFARQSAAPTQFDRRVPAASAVVTRLRPGIHALADTRAGTPIANPRQVAPTRLTTRFGRSALLRPATQSTSSEQTISSDRGGRKASAGGFRPRRRPGAQVARSPRNLAALIADGFDLTPRQRAGHADDSHFRVYFVRSEDLAQIQRAITACVGPHPGSSGLHADLCRGDLPR